MNIVFVGKMDECGTKLCNYLSLSNTVVAVSDEKPQYELTCDYVYDTANLNCTIQEKEFDALVFVEKNPFDYDSLHKMLLSLPEHFADRFLYVHEKTPYRKKLEPTPLGKLICDEVNRTLKVQTFFVETSCLYGEYTLPAFISESVDEVCHKNTLTLCESEIAFCDFMHIDDFCVAINSILQQPSVDSIVELQSGYPFPLWELADIMKEKYKQVRIKYSGHSDEYSYTPYLSAELTWNHAFLKDVKSLIERIEQEQTYVNVANRKKTVRLIGKVSLFIVLFFLIEVYTQFIASASELQFVDLRLLFVVVVALIGGKKTGLAAAVLCSIASVVQSVVGGIKWYVLFYNIDNWIPLTVYVISAIWIGTFIGKYRKPLI